MTYQPPSPETLRALKAELGKSSSEMAAMAGYLPTKTTKDRTPIVDGAKWRKLTLNANDKNLKRLSNTAAFHLAAHLVLTDDELARIKLKIAELTVA